MDNLEEIMIKENVANVLAEVREICQQTGRSQNEITIVAVTKTVGSEEANSLLEYGMCNLGENRAEGLMGKYKELGRNAKWHFIGSLQSNKVRDIIDIVDYIHSLDRISLAEEIQKRASKMVKCFVEIKTSSEPSKQGIDVNNAVDFIQSLQPYDKIQVIGLMTMAPLTSDANEIRSCFKALRILQKQIQRLQISHAPCSELSMGMSNDYKIAIQEGATFIRLGSILFGRREAELTNSPLTS